MNQRLMIKTVLSAAILASLAGCATQPVPDWNADTTYKLTVLHTNDHHGRFWQNRYGEYGMAARKTLIDDLREEIQAEGGACYCFLVVTSTQEYLSLIYKMPSRISKA